jgi:hypothetical protein
MDPYRSHTLSPIKTKLNTIHYIWRNSSRVRTHHQPIKGVRPTKGQHIGLSFLFVFIYLIFYFVRVLSPHPAKTAWPILTMYTSNDAVSRKEVYFGASQRFQKLPRGWFSSNLPQNFIKESLWPWGIKSCWNLKSLTRTVTNVVGVRKNFARVFKDFNTSYDRTWRVLKMIYAVLYVQIPCSSSNPYNWL